MLGIIEWISKNLNSGDPISDLFVRIILGVALVAAFVEILSILKYIYVSCQETATGIRFLKRVQQPTLPLDKKYKSLEEWLIRHFQIKDEKVVKEENKFIILLWPSILSQPVPRGPVYFAPTLLTALGVLGTFAGIYLGLQNINLANISEADNLLKASTELMEGMKLAFVTSLFGLGSSSFFMLFLAAGKGFRESKRNTLRKQLKQLVILETPVRLLSRLNTQQQSNDSLVEALNSLVSNLQGLSSLNSEEIGKATGNYFRSAIRAELKPFHQEVQQLRAIQQNQAKTVESLINQMESQLIAPIVIRLDESASLTKEASLAVRELKESLGGITTSLSSAISTIQEFQKTTLVELQDFARNLQGILGQFRTDTEGVMQKVASEIERAVSTSIEGMEAQRQAFEASAEKAAATFKAIRVDFEEELIKFREEYQSSLNTFFKEQNQLLNETLGKQREGLEKVVTSLQTVFTEDSQKMSDEIQKSMNKIKETVQVVSNLSNTIGLTSGERLAQLQELARTIGDEANQVSSRYQNLANQFEQALQTGNEQLANYLNQANEVYRERMQEFDQATADVCKQLYSTSNGFMDVAGYLVSAANDLRNTNGKN